jgi:predicted HD phosphohydrolase
MSRDIVHQIEHLLRRYGGKNYGEPCSQLTHCISCAWHAQQESAGLNLVVAAFLHDIGHFIADHQQLPGLDKYGHHQHPEIGANWLAERGFPDSIYQPIRYHVLAKRYLMTNSIPNSLSKASTYTLKQQGEVLTLLEQENFEKNKYFAQTMRLRHYDDLGKPTVPISLEITPWLALIEQVLVENNS